ncbi:hypothetical protein BJV82DRAFT_661796 [Fennellomyces sp. T-0311]|nr:hypothetical protein BJV82DRAFT_661796 [Fennellomyces sp. T-0311]
MAHSPFFRTLPSLQMLNYNPTNESFEEGKRAFMARKYDDAVSHYTRALEALQADLSSVIFTHRAAAYEKQGRYDLAAEDNRVATLGSNTTYYAPHSAKTTPQTTSLTMRHGQPLTPVENRNQHLVHLLPPEVLSHILSDLSTKDCIHLGMTCRFWFDFMFHKWPRMWHTVNPGKDFRSFGLISSTRRYIKAIRAEQVRDLHLDFSSALNPILHHPGTNPRRHRRRRSISEDSGDVLLDFMDYRWNGVEFLKMRHGTAAHFNSVLSFVGENLKKLTLTKSSGKNNFGLDVLEKAARSCPKLQTMTNDFGVVNYKDRQLLNYLKDAAQLSNFHITSLSMPRLLGEYTSQILRDVPALTSLNIDSHTIVHYGSLMESVHRHCPALEILNFSPKAAQRLSTTHSPAAIDSIDSGLKTLVIRPLKIHSDTNVNQYLASMLQRAYKTLQTLDLSLDILENGQFSALDALIRSGAPHLQTLILEASKECSIGSQFISNLIYTCPSLNTVKLTGANFWHDRIFDALANSSTLRKLSIEVIYRDRIVPIQKIGVDGLITAQSLRTFFERAQNIDDFAYNHRPVSIYTLDHHFILELIRGASSSSVRKLDLTSNKLTGDTLLSSLKHLQHSRVQTLKVRIASSIGNNELKGFASIPCLTHLTIRDDVCLINQHKVCALLDLWENPQMLFVHIRRHEPDFFIKGYKADLGTMRRTKDQITDPMVRYSIEMSNPLPPAANLSLDPWLLNPLTVHQPPLPNFFEHVLPPASFFGELEVYQSSMGPIPLDTFDEFQPIEDVFSNRSRLPGPPIDPIVQFPEFGPEFLP